LSSSGTLMVFVYMITAAAQIALRRRREGNGEAQPAVSMWLFPYLSYATIACMAAVLIAMAFTPGQRQDFNASCITLIVAVVAYWIVRRLRQPRTAASPAT
jgi:GABA permease